jgi:hypothetical protein
MKQTTVKLSLVLPKRVYLDLSEVAREQGQPKSSFVRALVVDAIHDAKVKKSAEKPQAF